MTALRDQHPTPCQVGVLGGGQLGRMLALAGYPLGLRFRFVDPSADAPAGQIAEQIVADYAAPEALRVLSETDVITYEFENVPVAAVEAIEAVRPVLPGSAILAIGQDRLEEKQGFRALGIPTAEFRAVSSLAELEQAVSEIGLPCVLKTRRLGYDGKGQRILQHADDVPKAFEQLQQRALIVEQFVHFQRELSIIGVRDRAGNTAFYPLTENHHTRGMLSVSLAPAPNLDATLQAAAESFARRLLERYRYVGVLALELFQTNTGQLVANELAPRVHNSGHWTLDGAHTSQFENHLRAICGLPLGDATARGHTAMLNLIGVMPDTASVLQRPRLHLHDYGKHARPGRKLGHINIVADTASERDRRVEEISREYQPLF